jgi:hypothetical protein
MLAHAEGRLLTFNGADSALRPPHRGGSALNGVSRRQRTSFSGWLCRNSSSSTYSSRLLSEA